MMSVSGSKGYGSNDSCVGSKAVSRSFVVIVLSGISKCGWFKVRSKMWERTSGGQWFDPVISNAAIEFSFTQFLLGFTESSFRYCKMQ